MGDKQIRTHGLACRAPGPRPRGCGSFLFGMPRAEGIHWNVSSAGSRPRVGVQTARARTRYLFAA
eukprot:4354891-Pyramimonas_sp.AAC.1